MGTNTMAYCSAALSFALPNIGKPVILTGAQIPAESLSTDARNNFINALKLSTLNLAGVFIVFGSKIIKGCRAKKVSESELDAFRTFNQKDFGEIGVGTIFNFQQPRHDGAIEVKSKFVGRNSLSNFNSRFTIREHKAVDRFRHERFCITSLRFGRYSL